MFLFSGSVFTAPKAGGIFVFGRGGDSVGLDPAYETDGNSFMVCDNIFEALVFYQDESTALEPGLAESWDISADGLTYTFHLRKGVKFHDGTPFNANAVVFSIGRMMKKKMSNFLVRVMKSLNRIELPRIGSPWKWMIPSVPLKRPASTRLSLGAALLERV